MESDLLYWLWLSLCCETGSSKSDRLVDRFHGDIRAVFEAEDAVFAECGFTGQALAHLCRRDLDSAAALRERCDELGVSVLTQSTDSYPVPLRQIMSRPVVLYAKGTLPDMQSCLALGMVGTRHMTAYGKNQAYQIAFDLAKQGVCVVSGMARGIDSVSHRGCLDGGGTTVAVLGCGVNICYPPENKFLYGEIVRNGCVLSEYPPDRKPDPGTFPARNRIISGLCRGTLVVEAGERSGALITAKRALSQGKDLFALPGNVGEQTSVGTNALIRNGAQSVTSGRDLLASYTSLFSAGILTRLPCRQVKPQWERKPISLPEREAPYPASENRDSALLRGTDPARYTPLPPPEEEADSLHPAESPSCPPKRTGRLPTPRELTALSETQRKVYLKIPADTGIGADDLATDGLSLVDVMTACTILEIKGWIEAIPGGLYRRCE